MSFLIRLRAGDGTVRLLGDLGFASVEDAYLDACAAIPEAAGEELRARRNPFHCAFLIADQAGTVLLEVPFTDLLLPSERVPARPRPAPEPRAEPTLALPISRALRERVERARRLCSETSERKRRTAAHIDRSFRLIRQSRARHFS